MSNTIDVRDLTEEDVKLVQELVNKLREKTQVQNTAAGRDVDSEPLRTRPLSAKGKINRKEIYDYL
ncbi:MAG: hypothetical protein AB1656_00065 [Candidatus Omnitrophota bacterium]